MEASQRIRIEGQVSAGCDAVRDAFADNFSRRHELPRDLLILAAGPDVQGRARSARV